MISYGKILSALSDCVFDDLCIDYIEENIIEHLDHSVFANDYDTGATKLCLYLRDDDSVVVKIPFCGEYENNKFKEFENAEEPNNWDYCQVEAIRYDEFKEWDMERYFLKTELIGHINGHPIYIQPKAEIFNSVFERITEERGKDFICNIKKNVNSLCQTLGIPVFCDRLWLKDFINYYTQEGLKEFSDFLENHWVTDLHNGNIGYYYGRPVIIDYAGYDEW